MTRKTTSKKTSKNTQENSPRNLSDRKVVLDHVAVAVEALDDAENFYQELGLKFGPREEVKDQKVMTSFASIDEHAHLELLMATAEDSPIAQYIKKRGTGIHHLCFRVHDVEECCNGLREKGVKLIYENARQGARGSRINFIHPSSSGGVLIEIVSYPSNPS